MIKVDQPLHIQGLTVNTGSVVAFTGSFPPPKVVDELDGDGNPTGNKLPEYELHVNMSLYKSLADFESGKKKLPGTPDEFGSMGFVKKLTVSEYASLDNSAGALSQVETWVKEKLESFNDISGSNLSIVQPFSS